MTRLTWPAVAALAVLAGAVVALATLTTWGSMEIIAVAGVLAGAAGLSVGAAAAQGVQNRVDQVHTETVEQTKTLATIERRTNGELDQRIESAMGRAAQDGAEQGAAMVLRELAAQGYIGPAAAAAAAPASPAPGERRGVTEPTRLTGPGYPLRRPAPGDQS